jgi:hypothetical protein
MLLMLPMKPLTSLADTESASCTSNKEMRVAVPASGRCKRRDCRSKMRREQKCLGLVLSLAIRKLSQQLLEDVGPKLIDTLKERRNDFSKN